MMSTRRRETAQPAAPEAVVAKFGRFDSPQVKITEQRANLYHLTFLGTCLIMAAGVS
jgi:hypothetical protein